MVESGIAGPFGQNQRERRSAVRRRCMKRPQEGMSKKGFRSTSLRIGNSNRTIFSPQGRQCPFRKIRAFPKPAAGPPPEARRASAWSHHVAAPRSSCRNAPAQARSCHWRESMVPTQRIQLEKLLPSPPGQPKLAGNEARQKADPRKASPRLRSQRQKQSSLSVRQFSLD